MAVRKGRGRRSRYVKTELCHLQLARNRAQMWGRAPFPRSNVSPSLSIPRSARPKRGKPGPHRQSQLTACKCSFAVPRVSLQMADLHARHKYNSAPHGRSRRGCRAGDTLGNRLVADRRIAPL